MNKKLLLINPAPMCNNNLSNAIPFFNIPPINLGYIAALTPPDWEIKIIDENVERYNYEDADLVGLTAKTCEAPRAYELASHFKEREIPTIMGGIHASMLQHEASKFVDTIVVGEAENIWNTIIKDYENEKLKTKYNGVRISLKKLIRPRRDVFSNKYKIDVMQTARGCPMDCIFCSVTAFNGNIYRQRPIEDVLDELETLNSKLVFFVDDNIIGHGKNAEERAIQLFKGIIERGLNIEWGSQASINFTDSEKVLKYAQESGCLGMIVGFESLNENVLKDMHKTRNLEKGVKKYGDIIKKFHDYGIGVLGTFILGNDSDKKNIFEITTEFIIDSKIDGSQLGILTPLPGTKIYQQLKKENRILLTDYPEDWGYYDVSNVVFKPKNMTPDELKESVLDIYRATTSRISCLKRTFNSFLETKKMKLLPVSYLCNRGYRKIFLK